MGGEIFLEVNMDKDPTGIRADPKPRCPICNHEGRSLYRKQPDRLFGAKGNWNLKKCSVRDCGLIWLDPMPVADDIPELYQKYYTHDGAQTNDIHDVGSVKNLYHNAKLAYWSQRYGYEPCGPVSKSSLFLSYVFKMLPNRRADLDYPFKWLSSTPKGDLLELGCGAGGMIEKMREWGWNVTGVEPDAKAVVVAQNKGLNVQCGNLMDCAFDEGCFDVIIMHHVFEHIENPVEILNECKKILRSNGLLLITTPNSESLGHMRFGRHWRGLEVPRHLMIYGVHSMKKLAGAVGMEEANVFSHGRGGINVLEQSYCLKRYDVSSHTTGVLPRVGLEMLWLLGWFMNVLSRDRMWGEELVFIWRKPATV